DARAMRSETRALLIASIARGRRWLNELIADPTANTESIARRECCSVRKVNMTISLAFLAPDLVKAAIEGRLPHGMGVVRAALVRAHRGTAGTAITRTETGLQRRSRSVGGCGTW